MQDDGETTGAEKNTTREIIEVDQILAEAAKKTPMSGVKESATDLSSNSDEDEVSEVESFMLDQDDLDDDSSLDASRFLLSSDNMQGADLRSVDPETQARLEALLEAAGLGKLSTSDGKAFADPEVLRRLTSSVSCALDEAAAALTRMRADQQGESTRTLAEACHEGDILTVQKLLDAGRSVHETSEEGESLLSLACSAGYYELAQVLLLMRANVEDRGIKGDCTPLMEAASGGYVDIVRLLIAHGADVNAQSTAGNTPLHYAACGGYDDVVKELIDAKSSVEEHNENGHTPLMEAASAGHVSVAKILLNAGAGINTHSNEFKESALTLACYKGHLEMVQFLLDAGADQEHKTDEMHTALMEASMDGHVEVARLLLDSGAQVNMPADSFESPLTLAACGGHVELANLLVERGANLEEVNDEGYTPLMEASREGHEDMVTLLLAHGADINAQTDETQETALTLSCCGGFLEVAGFLLSSGAEAELGCSTPLMEAAQEGHLELVKYLITSGANVQAETGTGDTALTYACENGHTDVADLLLQHNANLEHESEGGRTPLMKAARAGHLCTVQFLISNGADVNRSTAINDHTVLSLACAGGHLTVVQLLLTHHADPHHRLKDGSTMLIEAARGGHTAVVNLLLEFPNSLTQENMQLTVNDNQSSEEFLARVPMQGLSNVVPPQIKESFSPDGTSTTTNFTSHTQTTIPTKVVANQNNIGNLPSSGAKVPDGTGRLKDEDDEDMSEDDDEPCQMGDKVYLDKIPLPPGKKTFQSVNTMGAEMAGVIEQTGKPRGNLKNYMDPSLTNKKDQMNKKQAILDELQKVERELQEKAQAQLLLNLQQRLDKHGEGLGNTVDRQAALTMLAHQLENRNNKPTSNTEQSKSPSKSPGMAKVNNNNNAGDGNTQEPLSVMIPEGNLQYALSKEVQQATADQIMMPFLQMSDQLTVAQTTQDALDVMSSVTPGGMVSQVSPGLPPSPASPPLSASSPCSTHSTSSNTTSNSSASCTSGGSGHTSSSDESTSSDDSNLDDKADASGPSSRRHSGTSTPVLYVSDLDPHVNICTTDTEAETPPMTPPAMFEAPSTPVVVLAANNTSPLSLNAAMEQLLITDNDSQSCLSAAMNAAVIDTAAVDTEAMELAALETAAMDKYPLMSMAALKRANDKLMKVERPPCDGAEMDSPASPTPPETSTPPNTPPLEIPITAIPCSVTTLNQDTSTSHCVVSDLDKLAGSCPAISHQAQTTTQLTQGLILPTFDLSQLQNCAQLFTVQTQGSDIANLTADEQQQLQQIHQHHLYILKQHHQQQVLAAQPALLADHQAVLSQELSDSTMVPATAMVPATTLVAADHNCDNPLTVSELDQQHVQLQQQKEQLQTQLAIQKQIQVELQQQLQAQSYSLQQDHQLADTLQQFNMQPNSTVISAEVLAQAVAVEHQHVLNLQEQEKALEAAFQSTMSSSQQQQLRLQQVQATLRQHIETGQQPTQQELLQHAQQLRKELQEAQNLQQQLQQAHEIHQLTQQRQQQQQQQQQAKTVQINRQVVQAPQLVQWQQVQQIQLPADAGGTVLTTLASNQHAQVGVPLVLPASTVQQANLSATGMPIVLPTAVNATQALATDTKLITQGCTHIQTGSVVTQQHLVSTAAAGQQLTTTLPVAAAQQLTAALPVAGTQQLTTALPVIGAQQLTTALSVAGTQQLTTALPVAGAQQLTTALSVAGGQQLTTGLPVAATQQLTTALPVGTLPITNLPVGSLPVTTLPAAANNQCKKTRKLYTPVQLEKQSNFMEFHPDSCSPSPHVSTPNSVLFDDTKQQTPTSPQASPPVYPNLDLLDAQTESNHDTALTMACVGGHIELVRLLLTRGANIEHRDKKGFTPLILAATAGHKEVVEILLEHRADIEAQSERTKDTPLSLACSGGRVDVVALLLENEANKEHRNVSDYTPLSLAASGGYMNIIKLLLNHGAEINSRTGSKLGISPLMLAAMNGHANAVKLLLDMGSDINAQIETNRNTALTLACFQGRHEVVSLLVERRANIEHRAKTGLTPLMEAASGGYVDVGRVLLNKGADVNAPPVPSSRDTALTIAADKGHYRFVELLLSSGSHIDVKNKKGNSPLWLACNGGHLDVVQLLVNAGAHIDSQDNRKVSCLMSAFRKGHVKVVRWMVKHVTQFPNDQECTRCATTGSDQELLKKCNQCMEIINGAKAKQAAEANRNAALLLEEISREKAQKETKATPSKAKVDKRDKKKKGGKTKENNHMPKKSTELKSESPDLSKTHGKELRTDEVKSTTVPTVVKAKVEKKPSPIVSNNNITITTSVVRVTSAAPAKSLPLVNKTITTTSSSTVITTSQALPAPVPSVVKPPTSQTTTTNSPSVNRTNKRNRREKSASKQKNSTISTEAVDITANFANLGLSSPDPAGSGSTSSSHGSNKENQLNTNSYKKQKIEENQSVSELIPTTPSQSKSNRERKSQKADKAMRVNNLAKSPHVSSPKKGHQKDEGWFKVTRGKTVVSNRCRKINVSSTAISRVIGRAGCNINAIRDFSGANIEVDKQKGVQDRGVTIRGTPEAIRIAGILIDALIDEPDKDFEQIIARLNIDPVTSAVKTVTSTNTVTQCSTAKAVLTSAYQTTEATSNVWCNSMANGIPIGKVNKNKGSKNKAGNTTSTVANGGPPTSVAWGGMGIPRQNTPRLQGAVPGLVTSSSVVNNGNTASSNSVNSKSTTSSSKQHGTVSPTLMAKSPNSAVARQLFPEKQQSKDADTRRTVDQVKTTTTFTTSAGHAKLVTTTNTTSTCVRNPVSTTATSQAIQLSTTTTIVANTPGLPLQTVASSNATPTANSAKEFAPFHNSFTPLSDKIIHTSDRAKEDGLNFANVAAAGVVSTLAATIASVTTATGTIPMAVPPTTVESDPAMAPGYKGPSHQQQRTISPHLSTSEQPDTSLRNKLLLAGAIGGSVRGPGIMLDGPHIAAQLESAQPQQAPPGPPPTSMPPPNLVGTQSMSNPVLSLMSASVGGPPNGPSPAADKVASLMAAISLNKNEHNIPDNISPPDHRHQHQVAPGAPQDGMDTARLSLSAYQASLTHTSPVPGSMPTGTPSPRVASSPRSAPPTPRMGNHQPSAHVMDQQQQALVQQMAQQNFSQRHLMEMQYFEHLAHQQAMMSGGGTHAPNVQGQFLHSRHTEYSTPNKPMTLPKIESTLNPNAPDFTSSRMSMSYIQQFLAAQSGAGGPGGPGALNGSDFNKAPGSQQQQMANRNQFMVGMPVGADVSNGMGLPVMNPAFMGAKGTVNTHTPTSQYYGTQNMSSPQQQQQRKDDIALLMQQSQTHQNSPGNSGAGSPVDDRKLPRPIGTERPHVKKSVLPGFDNGFGPMGEAPSSSLWSFRQSDNPGDAWQTGGNSTSTVNSVDHIEERPASQPAGISPGLNPIGSNLGPGTIGQPPGAGSAGTIGQQPSGIPMAEQSQEQFQNQSLMSGFANGGLPSSAAHASNPLTSHNAALFPANGAGDNAQMWQQQKVNDSFDQKWNNWPPS